MAFDYTKTVKRIEPASGTPFKTPQALISGGVAQGVILYDDDENHVGIDSNPMATQETIPGLTPFSFIGSASGVIKNAAGVLKGFDLVMTTATAPRWLHFYDAAALPSDGAIPSLIYPLESGSAFFREWDAGGRPFSNGITWCVSSTEATKTLDTDTVNLIGRRV